MNPSVLSVIAMKPTSTLIMRRTGLIMIRRCAVLPVEELGLINSPALTIIPWIKLRKIGQDGRKLNERREMTIGEDEKIQIRKTGRGRGEFVHHLYPRK